MISKQSLSPKDVTNLLSKLKDETPEYPANLMEARKAAFLQQAASLNIPGKGQGGQGGQGGGTSGSGGSGAALGGTATGSSFLLQALIGFSVIAAMLLTAFAYREQISEILRDNNEVAAEQPLDPSVGATLSAVETPSPLVTMSSTQAVPTGTTTAGLDAANLNGAWGVENMAGIDSTPGIEAILNNSKTNPGLHLGQTPGTPAAPGQGNPGNINQPDKPDKPAKPDKPVKPDNPNKPEKAPK